MPLVLSREHTDSTTVPMPATWERLRPHFVQYHLWNTSKRFVAAAAGRGSGKTLLAKRKIIKELRKENGLFAYAMPTYKQAKRVAWLDLKKLVPGTWLNKKPNESDLYIETIFGSRLYVVGMDSPERVEGSQYDGIIIDEACDQRPGVYQKTIRPALSDKKGWCWQIGAIKFDGIGSGDFHDFCMAGSLHCTMSGIVEYPDRDPDIGYYNWESQTVWTPEEIESAKRQLDEITFATQIGATWQNARGAIAYAFKEAIHVRNDVVYCPQHPIVVGSDFNVNPMCWVLGHFVGGKLLMFDELHIRNTNTEETLNELHRRYGTHTAGWYFFGDASSRQRRTSAATTDYLTIKNDPRFHNAEIHYPQQNPRLVDRFACMNKAFNNAAKEINCYLSPRMRFLIKDLKQRAYKEGTREPNDVGDIGHMSDAFGYICYKLFPPSLIKVGNNQSEIVFNG